MCDLDVKKDWDNINFAEIKLSAKALLYNASLFVAGDAQIIREFVNQVELIRDKQIKQSTKDIPSLLKKEN